MNKQVTEICQNIDKGNGAGHAPCKVLLLRIASQ